MFEKDADPNVLSELEKSLSKQIKLEKLPEKKEEYQKHYKYYIENFLPGLKDEVIKSEELAVPIVFNNEREQSQRPQTIRGKIVKTMYPTLLLTLLTGAAIKIILVALFKIKTIVKIVKSVV